MSNRGLLGNLYRLIKVPDEPGGDKPVSAKGAADAGPIREALDETSQLVLEMHEQGRVALLMRPQISRHLSDEQRQQAEDTLDEQMGIVPAGEVLLQAWKSDISDDGEEEGPNERLVNVDAYYLDRYPVTNREFQRFVDAGGYEQMPLWEPAIWPAVLDFLDLTGFAGPRFWRNGKHPDGLEDHPVVGVSWYEANAYARWVGKRLPSDPEWVKAGCWPVLAQGTRPVQRKFPWGDTMDRTRAALWQADSTCTAPVTDHPNGVSVGGIYELIGNVWEWTTSPFGNWNNTGRRLDAESPMKSIRGGAFDTYFDCQASCQFQSGEGPLQRKHNIGFRCCVSLCDVAPDSNQQVDEVHDEDFAPCPTS